MKISFIFYIDTQLYRCYIYGATVNGKRKEHNLPLFLLFIDYEKAYDNVNRDKLWEMMDNKIPNYLLNIIKCIYRNTKIRIKFNGGIFGLINCRTQLICGRYMFIIDLT